MRTHPDFPVVTIGGSWGGLEASTRVLQALPADFPAAIILVLHQRPGSDSRLAWLLKNRTALNVISPEDRERIEPGYLYVAPPGYHMLVNADGSIAFSLAPPVHYSRPAIDETFFSVGHVYGADSIGVILTGANEDGAAGIRYIARRGGLTIVQSPETAEASLMPEAALATGAIHQVLPVDEIGAFLKARISGNRE
jgi:two-component system chemotaxis response regulator CheB